MMAARTTKKKTANPTQNMAARLPRGRALPSLGGLVALGPLLDPEQHLALHEQRGRLHRNHAEPGAQGRKPKSVAADQPRRASSRLEDERPDPVAVLRAPRKHVLRLHALDL